MTIKEAYKEGFAEYLADTGISPDRLDTMLKQSNTIAAEAVENVANTLGSGLNKATAAALMAAIGIPALAGWGLGATKRTGQADLQALTDTALIKDYEDAIQRLRTQSKYNKNAPVAGRTVKLSAATDYPGPVTDAINAAKQKLDASASVPGTTAGPKVTTGPARKPVTATPVSTAKQVGPGHSMPVGPQSMKAAAKQRKYII